MLSNTLQVNPTPAPRRQPNAMELLAVVAEALTEVANTGLPFTRHSVTQKARALHPELEIDHAVIRPIVAAALTSDKFAQIPGAVVSGHDTVLYIAIA